MENDNCILIMAGGKGTRFWPKSTDEKPKQFLNLIDNNKSMLQLTVERLEKLVPIERIFIATGKKYEDLVIQQIPQIDIKNIIEEPDGRNTAPCIDLACEYIKQIYGNCNLAVLPSDQLIADTEKFNNKIIEGFNFINDNQKEGIVTIGVKPTRAETGYGYIKIGISTGKGNILKVDKFVEKPNLDLAKKYVDSKEYVWNAGMFIFNISYMLKEIEKNENELYNLLHYLPKIDDKDFEKKMNDIYPKCKNISIDYAVMEKSNNIYVSLISFEWDDIGTWKSLERYSKADKNGNITKTNTLISNSKNCVIYGENKKIILIDVNDLYVIEGDNEIIVCNKNSTDKIREFRN